MINICPICKADVEYHQNKDTHIWSCTVCPIVIFEYSNDKNVEQLKEYLDRPVRV